MSLINPGSRSPHVEALRANAAAAGIPLITMDELAAKAMAKAKELGPLMPEPTFADDVIELVKADDGSLLDVIRRITP